MSKTLLLFAVVLFLAACNAAGTAETAATTTAQPASATSVPTTTATTVAPTTTTFAAEAVALAAIEAWNSGDFDAWLQYRVDDPDEDHVFDRSVMNSGEHIEVTAPCETSAGANMAIVTCPIYVEDDFHGAGGLTSDAIMEFSIDDDGLIVEVTSTTYQEDNGDCCPRWQDFHQAFHEWLAEAYPDIYEEIGPQGTPLWYPPGAASGDPDHMLRALEYVAEFVAQSEVYPLEDGVV